MKNAMLGNVSTAAGCICLWLLMNSAPERGFSADQWGTAPREASLVTNVPVAVGSSNASMTIETLDDKHRIRAGDRLSFRILEDLEDPNEPLDPKPPLLVTDSGELEIPYIGRFPALGKTCRQLAREIKVELEKEYYYHATVIIGLDLLAKSSGNIYVLGEVRVTGPVEVPGDEVLTAGKAVLRAGGFTSYSDKRHVKVSRGNGTAGKKAGTVIVNLADVLEKGNSEKDLTVEAGDVIFVPSRLINF